MGVNGAFDWNEGCSFQILVPWQQYNCAATYFFFQVNGTFQWSDGSPVGLQLWGPPYSLPLFTGESCMSVIDFNDATRKSFINNF